MYYITAVKYKGHLDFSHLLFAPWLEVKMMIEYYHQIALLNSSHL